MKTEGNQLIGPPLLQAMSRGSSEKCLKKKDVEEMREKKKKMLFFSPSFQSPKVSVVYTFETFNVYLFYTSTDIFLVLFYNGKN